jgi:tetratricopeptide (TPR) repeat protein
MKQNNFLYSSSLALVFLCSTACHQVFSMEEEKEHDEAVRLKVMSSHTDIGVKELLKATKTYMNRVVRLSVENPLYLNFLLDGADLLMGSEDSSKKVKGLMQCGFILAYRKKLEAIKGAQEKVKVFLRRNSSAVEKLIADGNPIVRQAAAIINVDFLEESPEFKGNQTGLLSKKQSLLSEACDSENEFIKFMALSGLADAAQQEGLWEEFFMYSLRALNSAIDQEGALSVLSDLNEFSKTGSLDVEVVAAKEAFLKGFLSSPDDVTRTVAKITLSNFYQCREYPFYQPSEALRILRDLLGDASVLERLGATVEGVQLATAYLLQYGAHDRVDEVEAEAIYRQIIDRMAPMDGALNKVQKGNFERAVQNLSNLKTFGHVVANHEQAIELTNRFFDMPYFSEDVRNQLLDNLQHIYQYSLMGFKDHRKALSLVEARIRKTKERDPRNLMLVKLARLLTSGDPGVKDVKRAVRIWERALAEKWSEEETLNTLAYIYRYDLKDTDKAADCYEQLLELNKRAPEKRKGILQNLFYLWTAQDHVRLVPASRVGRQILKEYGQSDNAVRLGVLEGLSNVFDGHLHDVSYVDVIFVNQMLMNDAYSQEQSKVQSCLRMHRAHMLGRRYDDIIPNLESGLNLFPNDRSILYAYYEFGEDQNFGHLVPMGKKAEICRRLGWQ